MNRSDQLIKQTQQDESMTSGTSENIEYLNGIASKLGLKTYGDFLEFPKFLQIETTALCNAKCVMCPGHFQRDVDFMPDSLFRKISAEVSQSSSQLIKVILQLDGEPLLDKKLEERARTLRDAGVRVIAVSTNGSLMDKTRAESILTSGINEVSFSVDGARETTFESIRRGLRFRTVRDNIINFINERNRLGVDVIIRIRMVIQESNREEYPEFIKFWQPLLSGKDSVYGKYMHNWMGWLGGNEYAIDTDYADRLNKRSCISPWTSMVVLCDGRVVVCCSDYTGRVVLGNLNDQSITEVWRGKKISAFRDLHLSKGRNGFAACQNCNVWDDEAKTGDIGTEL